MIGIAFSFSLSIMLCVLCSRHREQRSFPKTILQAILHSIHLLFPSTINFFSISTCFSCTFTLCL